MIAMMTSSKGPRFVDDASRFIAKGQAAMAAFDAARGTRSPATSPRPTDDTAYPAGWIPSADSAKRINFADRATDDARAARGAGVDYPALWDTSPVDANDEHGTRAARVASAPVEKRPIGAGVDYPADWAR